jgi:hypothetical protein
MWVWCVVLWKGIIMNDRINDRINELNELNDSKPNTNVTTQKPINDPSQLTSQKPINEPKAKYLIDMCVYDIN